MSFIKKRRKGDIVLFQVESKRLDESTPIRGKYLGHKLRRINIGEQREPVNKDVIINLGNSNL